MKSKTLFLVRLSPSAGQRGVALLITLYAIVLLTILIVAFFSRAILNRQISFSSTNQVKADMLTRSAIGLVAGELRQEVLDTISTQAMTDGYAPTLQGVTNPDANVGKYTIVKVCQKDAVVAPNRQVFGSDVSVAQSSLNGRNKSGWFSSGPGLGSADLPTWAYLTRSSGVKSPALNDAKDPLKAEYVVGRFTYTVYDTSGMLDGNVAGYPTSAPFTTGANNEAKANIGSKASTAYADLTALGLTTAQVDKLVTWRNASLVALSDNVEKTRIFDEWASGIPRATGTPNAAALKSARSGHLETAAGDNTFFSRRDLIRFGASQAFPADFSASLTHFSRAKNVPSWGPTNLAGSNIPYGDNADTSASVNRFLPKVTAIAMTSRVYHDDGTYETVDVEEGSPLLTRRFSLAKLAWLGHDGPGTSGFLPSLSTTEREEAIKSEFGLTWNSTKLRWDYNHGDAHNILTLDKVVQRKRTPDFFELLKAGILDGSVGGQPGQVADDISATTNTATQWAGPIGRDFEFYSAEKDRHIMQIGANIIDQADRDNYPTAIYQDKFLKYGEGDIYNSVYGVENIPVLQRVGMIGVMSGVHDGSPGPLGVWMQPELWNPHEASTAGVSPSDANYPTPSSLRMVTYGACYVWNQLEDPAQAGLSPVLNFGNDPLNPQIDGIICFKNPKPNPPPNPVSTTSPPPFFNHPEVIEGLEKATAVENYFDATSPSGPKNRYPAGQSWVTAPYLGVFLGEVQRDPTTTPQYKIRAIPSNYLTFVLEYFDGLTWRPYSMISRVEEFFECAGGSGSRYGASGWRSSNGHVDPRTDRLSGSAGRIGAGQNAAWPTNHTVRSTLRLTVGAPSTPGPGRNPIFSAWPRTSAGFTHTTVPSNSGPAYLFDDWAMNLTVPAGNNPISSCRYSDPDGITRPGDSWRADYPSGDGVLTYHENLAGVTASAKRRRPVILNRPFRSAGELGYVFRDQPFKSLDLWSDKSSDSALLDLFCAVEQRASVMAGQINPNAATVKVLQALMSGAAKQTSDATKVISTTEAAGVAQAMADELHTNGPLANPAELVIRLSNPIFNAFSAASTADKSVNNKTYGEAPMRALSASLTGRVWNLLVDVAAQSGRIGPRANSLKDFVVEGEKRYWLHLAIDRFTGEILDQKLEAFYE